MTIRLFDVTYSRQELYGIYSVSLKVVAPDLEAALEWLKATQSPVGIQKVTDLGLVYIAGGVK